MSDLLNHKRIAFIRAGWHADIVSQGQQTFIASLGSAGINSNLIDIIEVPGSLEIPLQAQLLARSGNYALIACGGLLVDGGIYRHEFVTHAVIDGVMRVMLDTGVPVLSMILTPKHSYDEDSHQQFFLEHFKLKGEELAAAALATLKNMQVFQSASSKA